MFLALLAAASIVSIMDEAAAKLRFHGVVHVERFGEPFERGYGMAPDTAFWVASIAKSFTAALEDYGHNGVVKLLRDGTLIVALSDVPAVRRDDVAQSRALGDLLEATLSSP